MAVLEEGACGACLAATQKLVTVDIPGCLEDTATCALLADVDESFADCKLAQAFSASMDECNNDFVELSQKKSECTDALTGFNVTTDLNYELLECPLGCIEFMEKFVEMTSGPMNCFPDVFGIDEVAASLS